MRTNYQSSSSFQSSSQQRSTAQGQNQGFSSAQRSTNYGGVDQATERQIFLKYASGGQTVISGSSDYGLLEGLKDAIINLRSDFFSQSGTIVIKGDDRANLDKRFLLFENELDGLLRRRIEYSAKDFEGGTRNLDFTNLLN